MTPSHHQVTIRPAAFCQALLSALDAAEGRRRARKRDQTPDAIGLSIKRDLLRRAIADDPAADAFEGWLLAYPETFPDGWAGARLAMARAVFDEWRLAHASADFRGWLERGAPSDDASGAQHPFARD